MRSSYFAMEVLTESESKTTKTPPRSVGFDQKSKVLMTAVIIGEGGYGRVYLGSWNGVNAAIKVFQNTPENRQNAQHEIEMLNGMYHTGSVVRPLGLKQMGVCCCTKILIGTEYHAGGTLYDWIRNTEPGVLERINTCLTVTDNLSALHDAGYIHNDISLKNILKKNCKFIDTQFSQYLPNDSKEMKSVETVGTLDNMAPEIWKHNTYSYKTDIYALGMLFYRIFEARAPYPAKMKQEEIIERAAKGKFKLEFKKCPELLRPVIASCSAYRPVNRPSLTLIKESFFRAKKAIEDVKPEEKIEIVIDRCRS